ncbi:MAG: FMN-binding glutamate synthase family protein [Flavobacteriaceae bacterium]|nr:FMN-binding glutamate synthase family protein [Flavobacteriaceae bacterium]
MKAREKFILLAITTTILILLLAQYRKSIYYLFIITAPLIFMGVYDLFQKRHTIRRNYPLVGRLRYVLESFRPELMQYFIETDTEGRPINRIWRSLVYQRSKKENDTTPFGTQMNVYRSGYEWMDHSMYAKNNVKNIHNQEYPRVIIGNDACKKPYEMSLLNISAMSFGSLSNRAVLAMNKGAKIGNFSQNTGEGGISPFHLKHGGDLIWQVGTGYFGCRTKEGTFSEKAYKINATRPEVKMIELKISQGAKPGHGGILPAKKNTVEIAKIRGIAPHNDVHSPPAHSAFSNPDEFMEFLKKLRNLSGGKPVGFKLCIGKKQEFIDLCQAMLKSDIKPDFITVDGGEGGTGAAPVEFSNSIGMPLREGLIFVYDTLVGFGLKKDIKIIAAGKIITGFHMARVIALGADVCNSARAIMLSIGCIQALQCNTNACPVGVATQNKSLIRGLNVDDKAERVANYHEETVHSFLEMIAAAGLNKPQDIKRRHINRRIGIHKIAKFNEIYPTMISGNLLKNATRPLEYQQYFNKK